MSDEHTQHRQYQTCFVHFPTNQELVDHVEEYRYWERILAAEMERCRMHIPQSNDFNGRNDSDDDSDDDGNREDDHRELAARPDPLQCPFGRCDRKVPFTTRGNLVRHFQTHIRCYEMLQNDFRKRKRGAADSGSTHARKMVRMIRDSVLPANAALQSHLPVDCSMATSGELARPADKPEIAAINDTERILAETAATLTANNAELTIPAEVTTSMPADDGGWAFTETTTSTLANDGGWAFAETTTSTLTNDGGWAFAETSTSVPANDGGWAFAEAAAIVTANDGGWPFAEAAAIVAANNAELTIPAETIPANDSECAFAETTASSANGGEGAFTAITAMNGGDLVYEDESATFMTMNNGEWAFTKTTLVS
ncbi:hypothetical protein QBC46DRAFT_460450 [Diplogelasinospora grovesii]|uniref:Uncharacterized protein n=1 Tax=Diplogelasinospora grovesii TaxID=303347 RepID=A0AAN6N5F7_9PEZI|nr:hypothetical protein QBC46DRAFT_460450 [Diplogelasinospora grovesii]